MINVFVFSKNESQDHVLRAFVYVYIYHIDIRPRFDCKALWPLI